MVEKLIKNTQKFSPALKQGKQFNKYQNKIDKNLESVAEKLSGKEGFQGLTEQTQNVINSNDYSHRQQIIDNLKKKYKETVDEYEKAMTRTLGNLTSYIDRTNSNNPYLNKTVKFSTGELGYVTNQGVFKFIPSHKILDSVKIPTSYIMLNIPWIDKYTVPGAQIPTNPPLIVGTNMEYEQSVGNEGSNVFVNHLINNPSFETIGCFNNKNKKQSDSSTGLMTNIGIMTFDECKEMAVNSSNQYFSLNDVDKSTGKGVCMVSNKDPTQYGEGYNYEPNPWWSSNTVGSGSTMMLTNTGSISVLNTSGKSVYISPYDSTSPSNYLGCYGDNPNRAMELYNNGSQQYNLQQCQQIAEKNGSAYFGLQNSQSGENAQCGLSNDLSRALEYGKAGNCTKLSDGTWSGAGSTSGGGWSNAVYNTTLPESNYFLIIDGGNMTLYRGSGPDDKQETIWSQGYTSDSPNPNFIASKSQYGRNYIVSGEQLLPNQFVGSNDGSAYLIMQNDGNLVLYTSTKSLGCKTQNNRNVGVNGFNYVNKITQEGIPSNMGKLAYIDSNSDLHSYDKNNNQFLSSYYKLGSHIDTPGNDIPNASRVNVSLEECEEACNSTDQCAGFTYSTSSQSCVAKNNNMYPYGGTSNYNPNMDLYIRNQKPKILPVGVSKTTNNIDTTMYQKYINGGSFDSEYGMAKMTDTQRQELDQIKGRMEILSDKIHKLTNKFQNGSSDANRQSERNISGIQSYYSLLNNTNDKIDVIKSDTTGGLENILKESNIVVLQKNYDYLFWSILAAGTVLVAMNLGKR
jgi:hypothetical protein